MKILLLNQCFYPDHMAVAQILTDLAPALVAAGHEVSVVASSRGYDDPSRRFPLDETWRGVRIRRIPALGLGKGARWRRVLDFGSFWASAMATLATLPRQDVVVCLTSPPLISSLGAAFVRLRGGRLVSWVMDMNPDQAVAAGWLEAASPAHKALTAVQTFGFEVASKVVVLDRFMRDRVEAKGVPSDKIHVDAPWSHDDAVTFDPQAREAFRARHGLSGRFVVMYSGNHSPCHPLDAVLEAAELLRDDDRVRFLFVGGGSEFKRVQDLSRERGLGNVLTLPYQPRSELSGSLSSADLHLVVMGAPFVGIVHPSKVYNIMRLGRPFVAISAEASHLGDLVREVGDPASAALVPPGDASGLAALIQARLGAEPTPPSPRLQAVAERFGEGVLVPRMVALIEGVCAV